MLSVSVLICCLACDPAPDLVARNGLEFQEYTLAVRAVTGLFAQASALVRAIAAGVETVWGTPLPWLVGWLVASVLFGLPCYVSQAVSHRRSFMLLC